MYRNYLKRLLDIAGSILLIILFSPLLLLTILALYTTNRRKIFFRQKRPGYNGNIFTITKFSTMNENCDESGNLLPDDQRLTNLGKFLRKFSIDELPQLFNVIRGEMSLVGPRPLLTKYLPLYNDRQMKRHSVKPGITGWSQVNGRNLVSWEEKFEMDVWYVENLSFLLDLKILMLTVYKIIRVEGISSRDSSTMSEYTGN